MRVVRDGHPGRVDARSGRRPTERRGNPVACVLNWILLYNFATFCKVLQKGGERPSRFFTVRPVLFVTLPKTLKLEERL